MWAFTLNALADAPDFAVTIAPEEVSSVQSHEHWPKARDGLTGPSPCTARVTLDAVGSVTEVLVDPTCRFPVAMSEVLSVWDPETIEGASGVDGHAARTGTVTYTFEPPRSPVHPRPVAVPAQVEGNRCDLGSAGWAVQLTSTRFACGFEAARPFASTSEGACAGSVHVLPFGGGIGRLDLWGEACTESLAADVRAWLSAGAFHTKEHGDRLSLELSSAR
ncbi:MAG: hypothetical protein R3F61_26140 [Myxococcota bacterium]